MKITSIALLLFIGISLKSMAQHPKRYYRQNFSNGAFFLHNSYIFLKNVKHTQKKIEKIPLYNHQKDSLRLSFRNVPSYISLKMEPSAIAHKEQGHIILTYDASLNKEKNKQQHWGKDYKRIAVFIQGQENKRYRTNYITVRAFITEDFSQLTDKEKRKAPVIQWDTLIFNFDTVHSKTVVTHDFVFTNKGKRDLEIRYAHAC